MVERVECGPIMSDARSDACRQGFDSECDSDDKAVTQSFDLSCSNSLLESLILAQDERWRRA